MEVNSYIHICIYVCLLWNQHNSNQVHTNLNQIWGLNQKLWLLLHASGLRSHPCHPRAPLEAMAQPAEPQALQHPHHEPIHNPRHSSTVRKKNLLAWTGPRQLRNYVCIPCHPCSRDSELQQRQGRQLGSETS